MKTVYLTRDFDYSPHRKITVRFKAGVTYIRVIDAAARAIERADAGRISPPDGAPPPGSIDASSAWRRRYAVR